jgi:hypothetical protein
MAKQQLDESSDLEAFERVCLECALGVPVARVVLVVSVNGEEDVIQLVDKIVF